jgi:hypothetical protein
MKRLLLILQLLITVQVFGQVNVQFIPELSGRSVDGLLNCRIINSGGKRTGRLVLTVSESKSGTVLILKTSAFNLYSGVNIIPPAVIRSAAIEFSSGRTAALIRQDHDFPVGDYEYCFNLSLTGGGGDIPDEQCFDYHLVPFAEMHLIEPYDKDSICDKKPTLTWQPLIPTVAGTSYQVVLAEIKSGQNAIEALDYNLPTINQMYLTAPVLIYPAILNQLEDGKTYAWQVTAYNNQTILNRSEIWQFTESCNEKKPTVLADDGYRDVADLTKGNYYIAVGYIKFALTNSYKPANFKYQIESLNEPGKKIKGLPKIKLTTGKNKIQIDLFDTDSFTDGDSYLMKLWLPDGTLKNLRFIYKD